MVWFSATWSISFLVLGRIQAMVYRVQDLAYRTWSIGLGWWLTGCNMVSISLFTEVQAAASRFGIGSYFAITASKPTQVE
ncbi:hypothetical protein EV127DRAFT_420976 [Xylaria flabelliformis]|nr:hypothetical protein EV127DRAFT_420976 [Xylaria flabelliformis]